MSASMSLAATISRGLPLDCVFIALGSSDFELATQDPIQKSEQTECRSNQYNRVENENADLDSEVAFFRAEENIGSAPAAIIALLHLRVGNQIGNFLVHINLFRCDLTFRFFEHRRVKRSLSIKHLIDLLEVMIGLVG